MHYWSEIADASVFLNRNKIGHIENIMIDPAKKSVIGFLLERKNTDLRNRFFPVGYIEEMKRGGIRLKNKSDLKMMPRDLRKNYILSEDLLNKSVVDEKGEWVGRVVDFAFDIADGVVREIIISGSLIEDLWSGRKKVPVLSNVEFSQDLIQIDRDTKEEITELKKGIRNWLKMD